METHATHALLQLAWPGNKPFPGCTAHINICVCHTENPTSAGAWLPVQADSALRGFTAASSNSCLVPKLRLLTPVLPMVQLETGCKAPMCMHCTSTTTLIAPRLAGKLNAWESTMGLAYHEAYVLGQ